MNQEIELKLEVAPDATARLMRQPWMEEAPRRSQRQISVYYDTADSELRGRGYSLRVRSAGERFIQTVKSLDAGAGLFERGEWEYQIDGPAPDSEKLWSTPLAGLNVEELQPVIRSDVHRTACRLRRDGAEIELDLDEGTMTAAGRRLPVHEIEIELLRGDASSAIALARRIAGDVPVKLGVMSKAERGFALADGALGRVTKAEPVPVRPGHDSGGRVRGDRRLMHPPFPAERAAGDRAAHARGAPPGPGRDAPAALRLDLVPDRRRRRGI